MRKTRIVGAVFAGAAAVALMSGPASADTVTSGNGSLLGGNQILAPISVPVNVCGNAIGVLGQANAGAKCGASVDNDF